MTGRKGQRGVAFLAAIILLVCFAGISVSLFYVSMADDREARFNRDMLKATTMAEASTEVAEKELLVAAANYRIPPTAGDTVVDEQTVGYTIEPVGNQRIETDSQGIQTIVQPYRIQAEACSNGIFKRVEKIVDVKKTPIFQYLAFYDDDMEILPGPSMTVNGRIHSNHDIYIGCGGTLKIDSQSVQTAGNMYRRRKNDGSASTGKVLIRVQDQANFVNMENKPDFTPPSVSGFDSDFTGFDANGDGDLDDAQDYQTWLLRSLQLWQGTVQTGEHGVTQIEPPSVANIKMYVAEAGGDYVYDADSGTYEPVTPGTGDYGKGYFYGHSGLTIVDNRAYTADGTEITSWPDTNGDGKADNPISEKTFYDGRENKNVKTTCVDLDVLGKSGYWPTNGLLYAARKDSTSAAPTGIRLNNGKVLAKPLTIVSPDPVYTKGDYNVGDATHTKQPAAVITDAFNILSNAWNDTKKAGTLPTATATTVNAAFISGSYVTKPGDYNGGFENLPRFHEKWDGVTCRIRGSFVNIWDSDVGQGQWVYGGDNYTAPNRDWNYDTDFNEFSKLPPFTPEVVTTTRVVWVSR